MNITITRRYTKDNGLNAFGDYKKLEVRLTYVMLKRPINGTPYKLTSRTFWLIEGKKGTKWVTDRLVKKSELADLLYNFFLQQKGPRVVNYE